MSSQLNNDSNINIDAGGWTISSDRKYIHISIFIYLSQTVTIACVLAYKWMGPVPKVGEPQLPLECDRHLSWENLNNLLNVTVTSVGTTSINPLMGQVPEVGHPQ